MPRPLLLALVIGAIAASAAMLHLSGLSRPLQFADEEADLWTRDITEHRP